jgi:hypothetical protein
VNPRLPRPQLGVVTAGVPVFDVALQAQGVPTEAVEWRPPVGGTEDALHTLAADPRAAEANDTAVGRMLAARPHLVDVVPAREAIDGMHDRLLLHAGPPIAWEDCTGPLRGAITGALRYEGLANSPEVVSALLAHGEVELRPCHSAGAVGPMAGVVSASMPMLVVRDESSGLTARCTLNEGLGKVLRFGAYDAEVVDRLRWMERVLGPALSRALRVSEPIDVRSLVAQALQMGDECHNRTRAATSLLARRLAPAIVDAGPASAPHVLRFLDDNDHFALNVVMAAAKATADAARDVPGSTMVVAMARNGTEFGIQTAGTSDRWFTAPAPVPDGLFFPGYSVADANPDLGDSTITETVGLGGLAMAAAPAIVTFVGGDPADATRRTLEMYEIALAEHDAYQIPALSFRGTPTGIDVTLVVRTGLVPCVNTGIAGRAAGTGQIGAGLVNPPIACFTDAVLALAHTGGDALVR